MNELAWRNISVLAMDSIPRISRAQKMDALSSMANIAGYRAVIEAAQNFGRFFTGQITAAGKIPPAKVLVIGAGVAGLSAIGAAKSMGAIVRAFDTRPVVEEQVKSLGAKFVKIDIGETGETQDGYAKELSAEAKAKQQQLLADELAKAHVIITTALIPCKPAPVLVTEEVVQRMREGSVIVDLAAATGGNCPLTEKDQIVVKHGVTLVGYTNFPALVPSDASAFYAKNIANLLDIRHTRKVVRPDSILLKPGPLTEEEWRIMRRHDRAAVEIVEADAAGHRGVMSQARHHDNASGRRLADTVQQAVDQHEVPEVVGQKLHLDAVLLLPGRQRHDSGVGDQPIERDVHGTDAFGAEYHRFPVGQVQENGRGLAVDGGAGIIRLLLGAGDANHMGSAHGQHPHGLVAEPRVAAGDQRNPTGQVKALGYLLGGALGCLDRQGTHGSRDLAAQGAPSPRATAAVLRPRPCGGDRPRPQPRPTEADPRPSRDPFRGLGRQELGRGERLPGPGGIRRARGESGAAVPGRPLPASNGNGGSP